MQKATIEVRGMSCDHCVRAVSDAILDLQGIERVTVGLGENNLGTASFEYDETVVTIEAIKAAIIEEGYEA